MGRRFPVPGLRAIAAGSLLLAAAFASAQGLVIPDLRDPRSLRAAPSAGCRVCGEIRSIREVAPQMVALSPGAARTAAADRDSWAVVGAAIVMPVGQDARSGQAHVGAVGTPDMVERFGSNAYEIEVRMDTGEAVVLKRRDAAFFRVGDRVTVSGGMMEKL